jgi:hypothetical protein
MLAHASSKTRAGRAAGKLSLGTLFVASDTEAVVSYSRALLLSFAGIRARDSRGAQRDGRRC